jgi:hypothetical protein
MKNKTGEWKVNWSEQSCCVGKVARAGLSSKVTEGDSHMGSWGMASPAEGTAGAKALRLEGALSAQGTL